MGVLLPLLWALFSFTPTQVMADDLANKLSSDSEGFVSPYPSPSTSNLVPFRPSIAVIVGVLTTMFSITFLLLLYAKHCKRSSVGATGYGLGTSSGFQPNAARRNSGIDRVVIDSLPVFRFASLRGQKEGLECAVCLCRFEPSEVLRLLPKCKHAFHVECVDTWLDAHSTCPLCRYRVDPEDILLVAEPEPALKREGEPEEMKLGKKPPRTGVPPLQTGFIGFSARHSSAGEKSSGSRPFDPETREASFRRSVDNGSLRRGAAEAVRIGCLDRGGQKDGPLLTCAAGAADRKRFEHRIIVSDEADPLHQQQQRRWSDLKPSDLLFLRSEMLLTESGRHSLSCARASCSSATQQWRERREDVRLQVADDDTDGMDGRSVINTRCLSEITGLSRLRREEEEKTVKRWLAFEPRRMADTLSGPEKRTV